MSVLTVMPIVSSKLGAGQHPGINAQLVHDRRSLKKSKVHGTIYPSISIYMHIASCACRAQPEEVSALLIGRSFGSFDETARRAFVALVTFYRGQVYDLMTKLAELAVTSQSPTMRATAGQTFLTFLVEYPLGEKRLQFHLNQVRRAGVGSSPTVAPPSPVLGPNGGRRRRWFVPPRSLHQQGARIIRSESFFVQIRRIRILELRTMDTFVFCPELPLVFSPFEVVARTSSARYRVEGIDGSEPRSTNARRSGSVELASAELTRHVWLHL